MDIHTIAGYLAYAKHLLEKADLLLSEQPEAITGVSHFCKHDVGGSTAGEETTSLVNDGSDTPSETQAVGGNKQTKEVCSHKGSYYVGTVDSEWCPQCKQWVI